LNAPRAAHSESSGDGTAGHARFHPQKIRISAGKQKKRTFYFIEIINKAGICVGDRDGSSEGFKLVHQRENGRDRRAATSLAKQSTAWGEQDDAANVLTAPSPLRTAYMLPH